MEVLLERLSELRPHEQAIRPRVLRIARSIVETGYVMRPIIVEAESRVILDGHHRVEALRILGARLAPVVEARYGVEVRALRPVARIPPIARDAHGLAGELEKLASGRTRAVLVQDSLRIDVRVDLEEAYRITAPSTAISTGPLLILPPLDPRLVLRTALAGNPYPPKTTNHVTSLKKLWIPTRLTKLL